MMMLSTLVLKRWPFSHRACLHFTTRLLSCQGEDLLSCKQSTDSRKGVQLCLKSSWNTYSGARGLRVQPKNIIIPQYDQDGVDPEKYCFVYQNRMLKNHLKFYAEAGVITVSASIMLSVFKSVQEIMEFDSTEFSLYHPILLFPCIAGFFSVVLLVMLRSLKIGTFLKSIYKHRENDYEYLGIRYTNHMRRKTEQFTFTVSDCVNNEDKPFRTVGNIFIKDEKYHLIDEDFIVPECYNTLMGLTEVPSSMGYQTLNRRRRRK